MPTYERTRWVCSRTQLPRLKSQRPKGLVQKLGVGSWKLTLRLRPGHPAVVGDEDSAVLERHSRFAGARGANGCEIAVSRWTGREPAVLGPTQHEPALADQPHDVGVDE